MMPNAHINAPKRSKGAFVNENTEPLSDFERTLYIRQLEEKAQQLAQKHPCDETCPACWSLAKECSELREQLAEKNRELAAAIVARDMNHEQWKLRERDLKAVQEELRLRLAEPIFAECQAVNRALSGLRKEHEELTALQAKTRDFNIQMCEQLAEKERQLQDQAIRLVGWSRTHEKDKQAIAEQAKRIEDLEREVQARTLLLHDDETCGERIQALEAALGSLIEHAKRHPVERSHTGFCSPEITACDMDCVEAAHFAEMLHETRRLLSPPVQSEAQPKEEKSK